MANQEELLALAKEVHNSNALKYAKRIETLRINFFCIQPKLSRTQKVN
jgi:hypothetical protein